MLVGGGADVASGRLVAVMIRRHFLKLLGMAAPAAALLKAVLPAKPKVCVDKVRRLMVTGNPIGGTFTVGNSGPIPWNADDDRIQEEIDRILWAKLSNPIHFSCPPSTASRDDTPARSGFG